MGTLKSGGWELGAGVPRGSMVPTRLPRGTAYYGWLRFTVRFHCPQLFQGRSSLSDFNVHAGVFSDSAECIGPVIQT